MSNKIDIGNVRGIQGEKGEKGDKGSTPSYEDIKYAKENDKFVTLKGTGNITQYYQDVNGNLCNEDGYILDENYAPTEELGEPFDENEYGYEYKPVWVDSEGKFTNEKGELLDENGEPQYAQTSFISDVTSYIYSDEQGYEKLVTDIFPYITETLISANPNDEKYKNFFDEIEGDVKYYICEDDPKSSIYVEDNVLVNTCKYKDEDGNIVLDANDNYASVPLEKDALYLYNNHGIDDNEIMHYNIYLCKKANTVPIKLISSNDYVMDYNVIDELKVDVETTNNVDEENLILKLLTRGTRGQFYSMDDVDTLFENNVIDKLGEPNGIAQLNSAGKIPSSQLPTHIDDVIEGTMNNDATIFTPSDSSDNNSVEQKSKIYLDVNTNKTYRWSGSVYIIIDDTATGSSIDVDNALNVLTSKFTTLESDMSDMNDSLDSLGDDIDDINNELILKEDMVNKVTTLTNNNNGTTYPSTSAVHTALSTKENTSNKSNDIYTQNSSYYPTCNAVRNEIENVFDKIGMDFYLRDIDLYEISSIQYTQGFQAYGITQTLLNTIVDEEGVYKIKRYNQYVKRDLYYYYTGTKQYLGADVINLTPYIIDVVCTEYTIKVNTTATISITLFDELGNTIPYESMTLTIERGPTASSETSGLVTDSNGCISQTFRPTMTGLYNIRASVNNITYAETFLFVTS